MPLPFPPDPVFALSHPRSLSAVLFAAALGASGAALGLDGEPSAAATMVPEPTQVQAPHTASNSDGEDGAYAAPAAPLPASTELGPGPDETDPALLAQELAREAAADASGGTQVTPPELRAALIARVQKRWDALISKDFRAAYEFETPEFRKQNKVEDFYPLGPMARWHVATVKDVRYHGTDQLVATIEIDYSFPLGLTDSWTRTKGEFSERWSLLEGEWWHVGQRRTLGDRGQSNPSPQ